MQTESSEHVDTVGKCMTDRKCPLPWQAATLYYADGGSFERVANTQRSSVDGAELGKGSMSARGTSVAGVPTLRFGFWSL